MTIAIVVFCITLLVLLITWAKINSFLAFLVVSLLAGCMLGIPLSQVTHAVQKGIGDMLGSLIITICLGAMLGKLVAESGAAQTITGRLRKAFGERYIPLALMITAFIVGIPLFFDVSFVLMIPLVFSVVHQYKIPAVYMGIPVMAALSVTHGFLPPHPAPVALVTEFHANMGLTLLYGIILSVPTIIVAGPLFAKTLKHIHSEPLQTFLPEYIPEEKLPGATNSFVTALLPVMLLILFTIIPLFGIESESLKNFVSFFGSPVVVMVISLAVATWSLGLAQGKKMTEIMEYYAQSVKDIAMILLVIAGAGALKQVFIDSSVSDQIALQLQNLSVNPLVLGWIIASVIRICVGSATVAGLTTASMIAPVIERTHADPNLMVIAVGAGSLMFSHVNDAGFWLYKEYFNISVKDTIRSWSLMETIVAVMGLLGALLLDTII